MTIFHMSFQNISAGKGRSAIAGAAYRSGEKLFDQKEGRSYFYARSIMPECFILTPNNAPKCASDWEQLWNEVEKKDRKSNSRYAKGIYNSNKVTSSHCYFFGLDPFSRP